MISLKKYLDTELTVTEAPGGREGDAEREVGAAVTEALFPVTLAAYRSALAEIGQCSLDASPALGPKLQQGLRRLEARLCAEVTSEAVEATEGSVRQQLQCWGRETAAHQQEQAGEIKEILLVMARTAEAVGQRDQRCARQIDEVTTRLRRIANLEDLAEVRASIEKSAAELKTSIDRMTAEGKAVLDQLRVEVANYQVKLEAAEQIASSDSLTGLRSRLFVEEQIGHRIESRLPFCVAIVDIDGFKRVNDEHGHVAGDELLRQFAGKLKSACGTTDLVGRWGGDEFIILLYCGMASARGHGDRLQEWVCGHYTIHGSRATQKLKVEASFGLAEHRAGETMQEVLARADAAMYQRKAASRGDEGSAKR